jgi:short-subunit dehydrogenase
MAVAMKTEQRTEIALITGASAGIGKAYAEHLAPRCKAMVLVGRDEAKLAALTEGLKQNGLTIYSLALDLSSSIGVARVMEAIRQKGPISLLINNAGFGTLGRFAEADLDEQQAMVNLHCNATLALCRAALPYMKENGGGRIINVSSLGSFFPLKNSAVYGASKAFLNAYSEALQLEVRRDGVKVQCLCPSYTRSEFHLRKSLTGVDNSAVPEDMWWTAEALVAFSLGELYSDSDAVICVPGDDGRQLAHQALCASAEKFK